MSEQTLLKKFLIEFSRLGGRLFRNNVGTGWAGKSIRQPDGSVLIKNPRPLRAGLCVGSSDLIGWSKIIVTSDMVGREIAVFTACEIKSSRKMKPTKEQAAFVHAVNDSGGIGVVAYDLKDLLIGASKYGKTPNAEENLHKSKKTKIVPVQ